MENLFCRVFVFVFVSVFSTVFLLVFVSVFAAVFVFGEEKDSRVAAPQVESRPAVEDLLYHRPPGPCCCSRGRAAQ